MKKHHSIFGTKSIPEYRKKEFRKGRNRRQAENKRNSNDHSSDAYGAWNDEDSYSEGSYGEESYNEESYDAGSYDEEVYNEASYDEDSYYDAPYNETTDNEDDMRMESLESDADDHIEAGTDNDARDSERQDTEDLEDAIYNAAEESSGAYQNLDDTVLLHSVVKGEKGSDADFPIDFLDDGVSDDTRDFDSEYDEDGITDGSNEDPEYDSEDYYESEDQYDPNDQYDSNDQYATDDYVPDEYEEYLEEREDAAYDEYNNIREISAPEEMTDAIADDYADDLKEEAEKEGRKKAPSKASYTSSGQGRRSRSTDGARGAVGTSRGKGSNRGAVKGKGGRHKSGYIASSGRRNVNSASKRRPSSKRNKKKSGIIFFLGNSSTLEKISLVIGLVVIITGATLGGFILRARSKANEISSFSNVGSEISEIQVPGSSGLVAVADAQAAKKAAAEAVSDAAEAESSQEEENEGIKINLSMASIKQDLKIKFLNSQSARLVSGIPFEVEIKKPDGSTTTWKDEDKDGIIYHYDIPAGTYTVTMKALEGDEYADYTFNTTSQSIEVKENIEYKPVDISDEVKDESQVNVAAEDTAVAETVVESENKDTVEWVESTKTEAGSSGEVSYEQIKKDTIVNPYSAKGIKDPDSLQLIDENDSDNGNSGNGNSSSSGEASTAAPNGSSEASTASNNTGSGNASTQNTGNSGSTSGSGESNTGSGSSGSGNSSAGTTGGNGSNTGGSTEQPKTYTYELTPTSATIKVGDTTVLTAKTSHEGCQITWKSNNEAVATVSGGTVTGKSEGVATITADFNNGEKTLTAQITVQKKEYTYSISKETLTLKVGATEKITTDTSLEDKTVTWSSADEKIAKVAADGTVTAVAAGTVVITATFKDGTKKNCTVTVAKGDGKIELSSSKATIIAGGTAITLIAKVTGLKDTTVIWKSSDESIAVVDKGKVTGKKAGTVKITATSKADASVTATCEVTVKDGAGDLKDKNGNIVYVAENGTYRKATIADYDKADKFFIQKEGKLYRYTGWQTIEGYTYYYDKNGNFVTGDQVIQGAKYSFGADGRLSTGSGVLGIDVSKWNGSIDWSQVKNSGVSYVIIRCGYRGSSTGALIEDPKFRANIKGATGAGLKVGVYFFTQAVTDVEAVEEASMVISLIKGYNISCPVFLDVEAAHGRADGISVSTRTAVCKAFCATIKNAGYTAGIYANKTWLNSYIDAPALTGYKIWLAQYSTAPTYSRTRYDMWQYSSKGSVAGISGRVDMNISYMGF
ncbi:GH25 family lysozyme [Butyrivibrio fibrisolvens]|uniref:GH25 family lysozyme n=1 Tax=Butyrivibrio fibrisolvens TaxID=831 RepID=UPI000427CE2E|nr:GH25 family lysozyme [Butyrivibrio fibrisolvens]